MKGLCRLLEISYKKYFNIFFSKRKKKLPLGIYYTYSSGLLGSINKKQKTKANNRLLIQLTVKNVLIDLIGSCNPEAALPEGGNRKIIVPVLKKIPPLSKGLP